MAHTYRKPPISSHRLFPAIVAIWFAALFGLGCLVLPAVLLEHAASASRIDTLVPAAAPPLGMTARIVLGCAAGAFGALLGFAIARRVAVIQAPAPPVDFDRLLRTGGEAAPERVRRPISASEELGDARLDPPAETPAHTPSDEPDAAPPPVVRRRSLALPEHQEPDPFLQFDPLPGDVPPWADEHPLMPSAAAIAGKAMSTHGPEQSEFASEPEPESEARPFDGPPEPVVVPEREIEPERTLPVYPETLWVPREPAGEDDDIAGPASERSTEPAASFVAEHADEPAATHTDRAPGEQPLPVAAPSQAKPVAAVRGRAALAEPLRALLAGGIVPADKVGGPLEHLGMAELAERLARSMHNYDSRQPAPTTEPKHEAPAAPAADFTPPPPVIPDALRPFASELEEFGEDEEDESVALPFDFSFAASPPADDPTPPAEVVGPVAERDEEDADELDSASYGSLLEMAGAPRPFDAPADAERQAAEGRPDPAETERALRSALATLQRMSGAA